MLFTSVIENECQNCLHSWLLRKAGISKGVFATIGVIAIDRPEVVPFDEKQIALLTNFAAQAELPAGCPLVTRIGLRHPSPHQRRINAQRLPHSEPAGNPTDSNKPGTALVARFNQFESVKAGAIASSDPSMNSEGI